MKSTGVKRIAIVGPECTGKSELAKSIAEHFQTSWVPEFARQYLSELTRPYTQADLFEIAKGQLQLETENAHFAKDILPCDTTLLVIKIWSEVKYGKCDPAIIEMMEQQKYDLHLLTYIDIPWEFDPLREHPNEREHLYKLYKSALQEMNIPFVEISGTREQRTSLAISAIYKILS